jgi:hypothetical protein
MAFPPYVHSVVTDDAPECWPIQQQGINECGCTAPANAMNLLAGRHAIDKDQLVREAGLLFQRFVFGQPGGTPSFVTGWLLKRHGYGTHFGSLRDTDAGLVLEDLIDRGVPAVVEIGANKVGPWTIWGQHSIVLVGYSDPYTDAQHVEQREYYFVDAQYPPNAAFDIATNDVDRDGDGLPERYPGNRTIVRDAFFKQFPTGIYYPVFPSQQEHDTWMERFLAAPSPQSVLGALKEALITGTTDRWRG